MKAVFEKNKFESEDANGTSYFCNTLTFYFDEDLFNDLGYHCWGDCGVKAQALLALCQAEIVKNKNDFKARQEDHLRDGTVRKRMDKGLIIFDISAVPDIVFEENEHRPNNDLIGFFKEIKDFATECISGKPVVRKRYPFIQERAPSMRVNAKNAGRHTQEYLGKHTCWGCFGLRTDVDKEFKRDNMACPIK